MNLSFYLYANLFNYYTLFYVVFATKYKTKYTYLNKYIKRIQSCLLLNNTNPFFIIYTRSFLFIQINLWHHLVIDLLECIIKYFKLFW